MLKNKQNNKNFNDVQHLHQQHQEKHLIIKIFLFKIL